MAVVIRTKERQSLIDLSIQMYGGVEGVFDLAVANGLSISGEVEAGLRLKVPERLPVDRDVKNYYAKHQLKPSTAWIPDDVQDLIEEDCDCGEFTDEFTEGFTACECGDDVGFSEEFDEEFNQ